jgi:hypothetical protein
MEDVDDLNVVVLRLPATLPVANELYDTFRDARPSVWLELFEVTAPNMLRRTIAEYSRGEATLQAGLAQLAADSAVAWISVRAPLETVELEELAEAHRHAADAPPALVIEHCGPLPHGLTRPAPTLRIHHLYGVLSALDVHVLVSSVDPDISPSRRYEVSELAGYDLELASRLADTSAPSHAHYLELCRHRAAELGLEKTTVLPEPSHVPTSEPRRFEREWQSGAFDVVDGVPVGHAGIATHDEVTRRLWRGQVRTILPFLDEMRLNLLAATSRKGLKVFPSDGDVVELKDLRRALERSMANQDLAIAARELTSARNDLAHLRLVDEARRRRLRDVIRRAQLGGARAL